mmetsp:Transcript_100643/g.256150  ORF Transcript_100643/g.256150 Transcript_100643/m.256150 type:complete len:209 (+) Transcript_100643:32-658(+)
MAKPWRPRPSCALMCASHNSLTASSAAPPKCRGCSPSCGASSWAARRRPGRVSRRCSRRRRQLSTVAFPPRTSAAPSRRASPRRRRRRRRSRAVRPREAVHREGRPRRRLRPRCSRASERLGCHIQWGWTALSPLVRRSRQHCLRCGSPRWRHLDAAAARHPPPLSEGSGGGGVISVRGVPSLRAAPPRESWAPRRQWWGPPRQCSGE